MIKAFQVQNFKILRNLAIEPTPLNLIIGPNGCGKSSLLQAIDFLRAFFMPSIDTYLQNRGWNYRDIPNISAGSKTIQWELTTELEGNEKGVGAGRYDYQISVSPRRYLAVGDERLNYTPLEGEAVTLLKRHGRTVNVYSGADGETEKFLVPSLPASAMWIFASGRSRRTYPEMHVFSSWIRRIRYFSILDPETLRLPDRGRHLFLGRSGEHLASILANFRKRHPGEFQVFLSRVRKFFPNLYDVSFSREGWGWSAIRTHEKHDGGELVFNNRQVSDGMLRLLAITSFLYQDIIPTVLMLEEPENGVHPHFLRGIIQVLRELTLRKGQNKCQVFFTSHNPYVLDEFYDVPEQVWVMGVPGPKAGASIYRLSDKSQLNKLKETFGTLGEAWFSSVLGGTPSAKLIQP